MRRWLRRWKPLTRPCDTMVPSFTPSCPCNNGCSAGSLQQSIGTPRLPRRHRGRGHAYPSQTERTLQQVPQLHPQRSVHRREVRGPAVHPQQKGGGLEWVIKEGGGCIGGYAHWIPYSSPTLDVLDPSLNGFDEPPIGLLEPELPVVTTSPMSAIACSLCSAVLHSGNYLVGAHICSVNTSSSHFFRPSLFLNWGGHKL